MDPATRDIVAVFHRSRERVPTTIHDGTWAFWVHDDEWPWSDHLTMWANGLPLGVLDCTAVRHSDGWTLFEVATDSLPMDRLVGDAHATVSIMCGHPYPIATAAVRDLIGDLADPALVDLIRTAMPDNYWNVDYVFALPDSVVVSGWAIRPAGSPAPDIRINGTSARVEWPLPSKSAGHTHWFIEGSSGSGFIATAPIEPGTVRIAIDWIPDECGPKDPPRRFANLLAIPDFNTLPTDQQIQRVSGVYGSRMSYLFSGLSDALTVASIAERYGKPLESPGLRVLDWGAGCGRMSRFMCEYMDDPNLMTGVDIDRRNVEWCANNLPGRYITAPLLPPVSEIDRSSIDLIYSHSVLTHLDESTIHAWLQELSRWLAPDGLALLSFNGEASSTLAAGRDAARIQHIFRDGLDSSVACHDLDGQIESADYYKLTLGTDAYMSRIAAQYFDVEGIVPTQTSGYQSILVLHSKKR